MFSPKKPLLKLEWLAHEIAGAYKSGVVDVKYEYRSLDTSSTRAKINKAITWKNKLKKLP